MTSIQIKVGLLFIMNVVRQGHRSLELYKLSNFHCTYMQHMSVYSESERARGRESGQEIKQNCFQFYILKLK